MSDISPVKVSVKADLTESIHKVVDTVVAPIQSVHKGIAKLFSACTGKWFANNDRQTALIAAQTAKDVADINAGKKEYRNGELINLELAQTPEAYYRQISENNGACDAKRLEAAMLEAAVEISNIPEEEISDDPLNQTFFNHWRAEAELIDEDDLRKWWAHLLVEEAKKPNSISPRTLHVARNLSREEANLFQRIAKGYCGGLVLLNPPLNNPLFGNFGEGVRLQDAGLLMSGMSRRIDALVLDQKYQIPLPFLDINIAIVIQASSIILSGYGLSRAGQELISILTLPHTEADVLEIAKHLTVINPNIPISVNKIYDTEKDDQGQVVRYKWTDPIWVNTKP